MNAIRDVVNHLPVNVRPGATERADDADADPTSVSFAGALFLKRNQVNRYSLVIDDIVETYGPVEDRWRAAAVKEGVSTRHV